MSRLKQFTIAILALGVLVVGLALIDFAPAGVTASAAIQRLQPSLFRSATPSPDTREFEQARLAPVQHRVADPAAQDPVRSVSKNNNYYIAVSYAQTVTTESATTAIPRVILTAVLGNGSTQPMVVATDALSLITRDGSRHAANPPDGELTPALLGGSIDPASTLYGFVSFDGVADLTDAILTWCVDGAQPCHEPIQSKLP
jgi:hypothetical protein